MFVGDTVHKKMVFHQRIKDFAIPFKKRIKTMTYTDPEKRIIKVIDTERNFNINKMLKLLFYFHY